MSDLYDKLKNNEKLLKKVLESLPEGVMITDIGVTELKFFNEPTVKIVS